MIQALGGEELTVFAQNLDGSEPDSFGPGREVDSPGTPTTPSSSPRSRASEQNDPRIERALEEFFESERLSRRRLHRPGRQLRAGAERARRRARRVRRRAGRGREGRQGQAGRRARQPPEDHDRQLDVLQLAALHRQEGPQAVRQAVRRPRQVHRGDQRQLRVLREGPPAAAEQAADRPRHRDADRLHGRALGPRQLRRADRQEERPELRATSSTTSRRSTTTRSASTRCRGSRARRASVTTSRRPAAS